MLCRPPSQAWKINDIISEKSNFMKVNEPFYHKVRGTILDDYDFLKKAKRALLPLTCFGADLWTQVLYEITKTLLQSDVETCTRIFAILDNFK